VRVTLLIGLFIAGVLLYSEHVLFFLALCYMLSGVFTRLMFLLRRSGPSVPPPPSTEVAQSQ
jgi:hypothetical protein